MKTLTSMVLTLALGGLLTAAVTSTRAAPGEPTAVALIPQPQSLIQSDGQFKLDHRTRIYAHDAAGLRHGALLAYTLSQLLGRAPELRLGRPGKGERNTIFFGPPTQCGAVAECYSLDIRAEGVNIAAAETGQFYALQSLLQLLPPTVAQPRGQAVLPALSIQDKPRFAWRGLHLDVGRHLFDVAFIKKLLDQMAAYKLNVFHWHLTEDQGWRIEIKSLPKLTEIAAYRPRTPQDPPGPAGSDPTLYGGFYTQEQIKEVVAYARARHITVVPEIELPGHSLAALAAYPELACTPGPFAVGTRWGVFEDIYCPSEQTFEFLEKVLGEVMALFPSPYIHIGGDEAPKRRWKESPLAQALMRREGLKDEEELQSYFIRRIERFIRSKGRRLIGWDEILEGGLAPNATVMSWRGEAGGIAAARAGHEVVMTPAQWCYFDAGQGPKEQEMWGLNGGLTLEKLYAYEPLPRELSPAQQALIIGVQANVWTERLYRPEQVEYMVFPRLLGMAEVAWSSPQVRDWGQFQRRVDAHFPRLDAAELGYRIPRPPGLDTITLRDGRATLALHAPVPGSRMYVSLDGSSPEPNQQTAFQEPLTFQASPQAPVTIKVLTVLADGRRSAVQEVRVPPQQNSRTD